MPTENQSILDKAGIQVVRPGNTLVRHGLAHNPNEGNYSYEVGENINFLNEWSGTRIRDPQNPNHLAEDLRHLTEKHPNHDKPILDPISFHLGYQPHSHPIEFIVRDAEGKLKQRIHTANIRTNKGGQWQGQLLFGGIPANFANPLTGTYTASSAGTYPTSASTLTSGATTAMTTDQFAGYIIVAADATAGYYGTILSHTSGTTPVFTVDMWHSLANNGSAPNTAVDTQHALHTTTAGSWTIIPGQGFAPYMALSSDGTTSTTAGTPALSNSGNNVTQAQWATSELATATGLNRSFATAAWSTNPTSGSTTVTNSVTGIYTLIYKFTAAGSGGTVARSGIFNSALPATTSTAAGNILVFEAVLTTPATLAAGDTLQVTWTINF